MTAQALIACPACDLLHRRGGLPAKGVARCVRCSNLLYRNRSHDLDYPLAMTLAALILLLAANLFPFITFNMEGRQQESVLASGLIKLYGEGYLGVALLVLLTGILCPLIQLVGMAYVLIPLRTGWVPPQAARVYRYVRRLQPWAMTEVYMLGILVTAAKLDDMGSLVPGMGLYAFGALMFILPAAYVGLNSDSIWERMPYNSEA